MKLRLPVRLKLAVLAGLRSVAQATLASGFLAVGAVFFSFSSQAEDDPLAVAVEDEDETAVLLDEEASDAALAGAGVAEAALDDSQAAALAEAEQEHAAELGINATSSAVSQAAIAAQDAAVSPAQAAGGSHADSFVIVSAADAPALTLPAAEGAVAPSLCAEGAADSATSITPVKTASVAVLPQASTSLTLSEDVVMASSPVAEVSQISSSSAAVAATSSSSGGAVACGGGAAGGGGGGSSASFSTSAPVSDVSPSGSVVPSDLVDPSEDVTLAPSEPSPSLPDDSELVDTSPSSDSSSLSDSASLSSSLSDSASTTGASSSSPAARAFSFKLLGSTSEASETESTGTSGAATPISGNSTLQHELSGNAATELNAKGYIDEKWASEIKAVCKTMTSASSFVNGNLYGRGNNRQFGDWSAFEGDAESVRENRFRIYGRSRVGGEWMGSAYRLTWGDSDLLTTAGILSTSVSLTISAGDLTKHPSYILETGIVQIKNNVATLLGTSGSTELTSFNGTPLTLQAESLFENFSYDADAAYYVIFRIAGTGSATPSVTSYNTVTVDSWSTTAVNRLTWSGTSEHNVWSASSEKSNWTLRENATQYQSGAAVSFTADAAAEKTVNLEGDLTPYSVAVSGGNYFFKTQNDTTTSTLAPDTKVSIASGASLDIGSGVTLDGKDLSVEGKLTNSAGNTTFTGLANVSGTVNVTGGSLTLSGTNNFVNGATLSKGESGEMHLSGTNHVSGTLTITSGTVDFSGATTLSSGTMLSVNDGAQLLFSDTTDVSGTLTVSQGSVQLTGTNTLAAGTTFSLSNTSQVSLSGTTVIAGELTVTGGALELGGTITNNGSQANLKVVSGGSYKVVVSEKNKLRYDGFEIWKSGTLDVVLSRRENDGRISLLDSPVNFKNASLMKLDSAGAKTINATLTDVAFTNTGAAETDIAGTATFSSLTNEGTNLKVSGTATINGQLSTGSTITNTGTIKFGEGTSIVLTSLNGLGGLYNDPLNSGISSGYLEGRLLINGGTTTKDESLSDLTAKCGETNYNLTFAPNYNYVLLDGTGETGTQRQYYINAGDSLLYGGEGNSLASDATSSIVLNGGTLEIGTTPLGKTAQLNCDSWLQLNDGATLAASSIDRNGNTLKLKGSGVYDMGTLTDNGRSLSANGISLGDSWTGVLKVSSAGQGWTNLKLNDFVRQADGVAVSSVELAGVTAWMNTERIKANVILTNPGDNEAAFIVNDGSSDKIYTFEGKVSGSGDMKVTATGPNNMIFSFVGDLTKWTGSYIMAAAGKTSTIRIAGNSAQNVNAAIDCQNGTLKIEASANEGVTFANSINATSLTATKALTLNAKDENGDKTSDRISGALDAGGNSVTVGQNVELTVAGMTTGGSLTNAGTVNLKGGASITKTLVNKGSLTVGTGSNSPHLTIGAPIINSGNMTVKDGTVLTFAGDEAELVCSSSGAEFNDTAAGTPGASSNGFITKGNFYLILNQNGTLTMSDSVVNSITVNGVAVSATKDDNNSCVYYAASQSEIASLDSTYFVNTGNVVYGATDNSAGNPTVTELCLTGGTLALAGMNLASWVSLLVTGDSTVSIGAGRTLSEEVLTVSRGSLTLTGAGTYRMTATDFGATAALTEGVVLGCTEAAAFTGTVWLSSGTTLSGTDLSRLTNESNSTVTLNGVSGYLNSGTIGTNLVLMNDGAVPALAINYGTDNDERTFTGSISGTGTIARTNRMEGNNTEERGGIQNFAFTGNIAEWTGVFDNQVSLTTNLTFGGEATTVNATLKHTAKGGALNVTTANNTDVSFNGGISVTSLTAGKNSTITLYGNSKVSGAVDGSFEVGASGSLTVGSAAELTDSTVSDGGSVAELTGLTVRAGGSVTLNGTATATGAVIVENGGYLALGRNGLTLSGASASLTLNDGAIVALQGWTATDTITYSESKVYTTGYSGGKLFSLADDFTGSAPTFTNVNFTVVKDGASFTNDPSLPVNRVTVNTNDGTVTITTAAFYNVASGEEKTIAEATKDTVDYINVLGTLTGVKKDNIGSLGFGATGGVQGSGTLKLGGELKDGYYLSSFTGTIDIGAGSTFVTDGNVGRTIKLEGGTLRATADMTLKNVSAASGTANKIEVDAGKAVIITSSIGAQNAAASITKTGEGTLTLGAINSSGNYIRGTMYGDLTVEGGEVVLVTPNDGGGEKGTVVGNITIKAGGAVTANGIDPLGYSDSTWSADRTPNCAKTLTMSGEENAYAILNIASGKHVTLSTEVYMNGYAQINGRLLNAWSSTHNTGEQQTAYVKARGLGNVINADFYLRHHALFEVEENGELSLNGSILKFTLGGAFDKPIFRKAGAGTLILDSPTATTLYNLRIEAGEVCISTDLSFAAASALEDFSMTKDSSFTVVDDGRFTYGGWTYEMKDGSSKVATVTASSTASGSLLSLSGITIADTKLTNTAANTSAATNTLTISANLDNVAFTQDNGGSVTIANAADGAGTQHLSSLAVNAGSVTLNNARLDAAKVASGATLNFTKGTAINLGSTIQNAGMVALTGTEGGVSFTVSDLSGFETYGAAGYQDSRYKTPEGGSDTDAEKEYNGFFLGNQYYLVKNADGMSGTEEATVSGMNVLYGEAVEGGNSHVVSRASDGSLYFSVSGVDTKYYINNSTQKDTNYTYSADAENSMYAGYAGDTSISRAAFATSGIVMNAEGGRLILATNLREDERNEVSDGIIMNQAGSITVKENVTLKQSSLSGKANATLEGAGIYEVGGTVLSDIAKGFTDTAWTGTVQVSGAAEGMKLSYMGNAGSTVQMTGVSGTLEDTVTDAKTYAMNIALVNGALVNGEERALALEFTANNGSDITFSGKISGAGNMKLGGATAQTTQDITFSGDISKWTGAFESGQGTVNLTLTGGAAEVNASILKLGGQLNVIVDGSVSRTFTKGVTADTLTVSTGDAESPSTIDLKGGGMVSTLDLTAENVVVQIRDNELVMSGGITRFSEAANSGIDIADSTGDVKTTLRTYVPTTPSTQAEEGDSGERAATFSGGTITNAVFSYDATLDRAKIVGLGTGRIENTIIDLKAESTLELSNMVLADTVKITDDPATLISDNIVVELGSGNAKVGTAGKLEGVTLKTTGTTEEARANVSGKVYTIDFTGIQNVAITSGTLTFDFNAYSDTVNGRTLTGFELFYELGKTYDYIAVNFVAAATLQYETLEVQSQITNGQGETATSTGYYNATATSEVVVYFDALALPEPTTSTLALLALTALCARRRRPQTTR